MPLALIVLYPLLVHLSVVTDVPQLQVVAIICFAAGILLKSLQRGNTIAWLVLVVVSLVAVGFGYLNITLYVLYLPPILLPLLLLFVFGRTLLPGQEPLITAIGEASRGPLTPAMRHYTRRITQFWCAIFFLMMSWSLILPWLEQPEVWSWFTNIINYGLVAMLFIGEFILRKRLFPEHNHPGFVEYLRIVANANIRH
jgi:uncharacterized membrane protein